MKKFYIIALTCALLLSGCESKNDENTSVNVENLSESSVSSSEESTGEPVLSSTVADSTSLPTSTDDAAEETVDTTVPTDTADTTSTEEPTIPDHPEDPSTTDSSQTSSSNQTSSSKPSSSSSKPTSSSSKPTSSSSKPTSSSSKPTSSKPTSSSSKPTSSKPTSSSKPSSSKPTSSSSKPSSSKPSTGNAPYGGYYDSEGNLHAKTENVPTDSDGYPIVSYYAEDGGYVMTQAEYDAKQKYHAEQQRKREEAGATVLDEDVAGVSKDDRLHMRD